MCRTDVAQYYPSIGRDVLERMLASWHIEISVCRLLLHMLEEWELTCGLKGLPIGPEACGVLGNALLAPFDQAIERLGIQHYRWSDDSRIFTASLSESEEILQTAQTAIDPLGLLLSKEKTRHFTDLAEARLEINDPVVSQLEHTVRLGESAELHTAFDTHVLGGEACPAARFRWIVRTMENKRDAYGAAPLATQTEIMNRDPRVTTKYLASVGLAEPVASALLGQVAAPQSEDTEGLDLHSLRALSMRRWGTAEGALFESIAEDGRRRPPVRAWAWSALSKTPRWNADTAMDYAASGEDWLVRRAALLGLRPDDERMRKKCAAAIRRKHSDLAVTADWLAAA